MWRREPDKAISHVAIGDTSQSGGQWAENPVSASADIGTLSYAEQLSLPGYSYADHLAKTGRADQCDFVRPSRTEVADYLRVYPSAVGISDAIYTATRVNNVYRTSDGFVIGSLGIRCKHLVLASGIFTVNIPPPPLLAPIAELDTGEKPLLVIGSGFSAADVIISVPQNRKIIHMYQWAPETRPSPLRGCHHTAYPEYATIYGQMKLAVMSSLKKTSARSPLLRRKSNPFFQQRDWATLYEGLPNAKISAVSISEKTNLAIVVMRLPSGEEITREVGGLAYVVGRRGSLDYLSSGLLAEVLTANERAPIEQSSSALISARTLRTKAESSLEVAKNVFVIGSLAGDSLIRHAVGGCVFAAGRIQGIIPSIYSVIPIPSSTSSTPRSVSPTPQSERSSETSPNPTPKETPSITANGHVDLHLDRRKLARSIEVASVENRFWVDSGWWAGGLGPGRSGV